MCTLPSGRVIREAGKVLAVNSDDELALKVLNQWREHHGAPLCQLMTEAEELCSCVDDFVCVGRIKRTPSIIQKLKRKNSNFELHTFEDVAAYRIIVPTLEDVEIINSAVTKKYGEVKERNYIERPRDPGYRSLHRIIKVQAPPRDVRIELQIRTYRQHAFATLIELYDIINGSNIKNVTNDESSSDTEKQELIKGFRTLSDALYSLDSHSKTSVEIATLLEEPHSLELFQNIMRPLDDGAYIFSLGIKPEEISDYVLIRFNKSEQYTRLEAVEQDSLISVLDEYNALLSSDDPKEDAVLIKTNNLKNLEMAYPLYTFNAGFIINCLNEIR